MNLSDCFQVINITLQIITSIIIFCTLLEMRKQRMSLVKPEIFLRGNNFSILGQEINYEYEERIVNPTSDYSFYIMNIGLSIAKDIYIEFDYSIKEIKKVLESKNVRFIKNERGKYESVESDWYSFKFIPIEQTSKSTPFLDVSKEMNSGIAIEIPDNYLKLIMIFDEKCKKEENFNSFESKLPPLKIKISCKDLLNNKQTFKFNANPHPIGSFRDENQKIQNLWSFKFHK
jgi:hypothetical protein